MRQGTANADNAKAVARLCGGDINFLANPSLRNCLFDMTTSRTIRLPINGYRVKNYTFKPGMVNYINSADFEGLFHLSNDHSNLFKKILANGEIKSLDELKNIQKNIKNISLNGLDDMKINRITEILSRDVSVFGEVTKLDEIVDGVRR